MFSLICGGASILITIILYLLILESSLTEAICLITLLGLIIAEGVSATLFYCAKADPRKMTAAFNSLIMIPIALILSIVYIVNFPEGYITYLGIYAVAFILVMSFGSFFWGSANKRKQEDNAVQSAKANMLEMRKIVKFIMSKPNAQQYRKELYAIEEKLHFTNDCVILEMDANIRQMLIMLDNNIDSSEFNTAEYIQAISNEIDRRNIFSKNTI